MPLVYAATGIAVIAGFLAPPSTYAQATPWKIEMRQVRLPADNGDCAPIEVVARDASGHPPVTPDGKQIDWQDFEITLTQGAGPLTLKSNGRFLCATAPGATGVVTAKYPEPTYLTGNGKGRTGKRLIPGVTVSATLEVRSAGTVPSTAVAAASTAGTASSPVPVPVGARSPAALSPTAPFTAPETVPVVSTDTVPQTTVARAVVSPTTPTTATDAPTIQTTLPDAPLTTAIGTPVSTALPPRINIAGFSGKGLFVPPPRLEVSGFTGHGLYVPSPRIVLPGFAGSGKIPPQ